MRHLEINLTKDLNITVLSTSLPLFEVFSAWNGTEVPKERERRPGKMSIWERQIWSMPDFLIQYFSSVLSWQPFPEK